MQGISRQAANGSGNFFIFEVQGNRQVKSRQGRSITRRPIAVHLRHRASSRRGHSTGTFCAFSVQKVSGFSVRRGISQEASCELGGCPGTWIRPLTEIFTASYAQLVSVVRSFNSNALIVCNNGIKSGRSNLIFLSPAHSQSQSRYG